MLVTVLVLYVYNSMFNSCMFTVATINQFKLILNLGCLGRYKHIRGRSGQDISLFVGEVFPSNK